MEITSNLTTIFRKVFLNKNISINTFTTASDIAGWDSLTHIELIAEIEDFFKIRFSFNEVVSFKNIGDIIDCITKHLESNKK